jgi:phage antirepressor YoqD-like protein
MKTENKELSINEIDELIEKFIHLKENKEDETQTSDLISFSEAGKILSCGRNSLYAFCRFKKILMTSKNNLNFPYQKFINWNYFTVVEKEYLKRDGKPVIKYAVYFTQLGFQKIKEMYLKEFENER